MHGQKKGFKARVERVGKRCANGIPFHTEGPTTENARDWLYRAYSYQTREIEALGPKGKSIWRD